MTITNHVITTTIRALIRYDAYDQTTRTMRKNMTKKEVDDFMFTIGVLLGTDVFSHILISVKDHYHETQVPDQR